MKVIKGMRQYLAEGLQLEKSGNLSEAAMSYEKVVDRDPTNQEAVSRLLIIYRKLKEYRKELAVIDNAIGGYKEKDKAIQEDWLRAHPGAASAGKAVLRSLGGGAVSSFASDPIVNRLLQRKELVERKVGGGTAKRKSVRPSAGGSSGKKQTRKTQSPRKKDKRFPTAGSKKPTRTSIAQTEKQEALKLRREAAEQQRQTAKAEREAIAEAAEYRRQQEKEKKEAAAEARKKVAASRKAQVEAARAEKQAIKKAAAEAKSHPTLFVITLRYLVPLNQIDAEMHRHVVFLDKYYKSGHILISGRQVPRNGGVIIARAQTRDAAERMMNQDPFVRKKLASIDIMEFSASRIGKGWNNFSKAHSGL